ncbi:hypothetical protein ADUPG1_001234, partial [Aduncisulcus paluster]
MLCVWGNLVKTEYLVSARHQRALNTSLDLVHTALRSYRLNVPVSCLDCAPLVLCLRNTGLVITCLLVGTVREVPRALTFRGRRSRNKVS